LVDDAKIRRIFAPIDVLSDEVWGRDANGRKPWMKAFRSRAATYVSNLTPLLKKQESVSANVIDA
jgi:hypothetical protein